MFFSKVKMLRFRQCRTWILSEEIVWECTFLKLTSPIKRKTLPNLKWRSLLTIPSFSMDYLSLCWTSFHTSQALTWLLNWKQKLNPNKLLLDLILKINFLLRLRTLFKTSLMILYLRYSTSWESWIFKLAGISL